MAAENASDAQDPAPVKPRSGLRRFASRIPWWLGLAIAAIVLGFIRSILSGVATADEAWFLYVLHRLDLGQVLYRDVWVPVFPLAVWLGQAFTKLLGTHVFVLKFVDTLCFAATAVAVVGVVRRVSPRAKYGAFILAVMLGWTGPGVIGPGSIYTALGYALVAATLAVALAWIDSGFEIRSRRITYLLAAAALAGLAFASKQTIGILAIGGLCGTILFTARKGGFRRSIGMCAVAVLTFAGVIALTVIPAALSGGLPAMLRDTVSSSGSSAYLSMASIPYLAGLIQFLQQLLSPPSLGWVGSVTLLGAFIVPLVVIPLFVWAMWRTPDIRLRAIGIFSLAALGGSYPRADYPHFIAVMPFLLIALIVGWEALRPHLTDNAIGVAIVLVIIVTGARLAAVAATPLLTGENALRVSKLASFQGAFVPVAEELAAESAVRTLNAATQKNIFILSLRGGLLYLASGREDPTAYDYPDLYGFGSFEQDDVINAVEDGRIEAIWFDSHVLEYLGWEDSRIMAYVLHAMRPYGYATPWGQLYVPAGK